jgi:hypothetical protein
MQQASALNQAQYRDIDLRQPEIDRSIECADFKQQRKETRQ